LVDSLPADEAKWDVITGISVGSINAMGISQFAQGDEKNMANWLIDLWYKIGKEDVYKPYIGGILTGLLYERGIYNTAPLKKTLQK
jgi:predicted acylesterase/phospholipase RssA